MKRKRRVLLIAATAALGTAGSAFWWGVGSVASRAATGSTQPQVVNAATGDAFAPASGGAAPASAMSASQAIALFKQQDPGFSPPGSMSTQAGYLYPGPGQSQEGPAGRAVWALTWHECPVSHDPNVTGSIDGGLCTRWLFLDATTGNMIVAEYQIPATTASSMPSATAAKAKTCKPMAGAAVRTLRLSGASSPTVRAHVGDTIKVVAHMRGYNMTTPKALKPNADAVCRISVHRVSPSNVTVKFRALAARKVTFGAVASRDNHAPMIVGYAKIKS